MLEVNLKTTIHRERLEMVTRIVTIDGEALTADQIQRVCSILARHHRIAATPYHHEGRWALLTEFHERVPNRTIAIDTWSISLTDTGQKVKLRFAILTDRRPLGDLYLRRLLVQARQKGAWWTLDSPRILYENRPFSTTDDIDGFRRYELAEAPVEGVGLTLSVHVSTSFFTNKTVYDYFSSGQQDRFNELTARQAEQKGTLLYDGPNGKTKCYFEQYRGDLTLATASAMHIDGEHYQNPYNYYQRKYPQFAVSPDDQVAYVSFPGIKNSGAVLVPANRLYLRVMNDSLDEALSQVDKIDPAEREPLTTQFWAALGPVPLGEFYDKLEAGFYRPNANNSGLIPLKPLLFGQSKQLLPPAQADKRTYGNHFRDRRRFLDQHGCFHVPSAMRQSIYFAVSRRTDHRSVAPLVEAVCQNIQKLTGLEMEPTVLPAYDNYLEAALELKREHDPAMVVFVFDDTDPVTYYNISQELSDWYIKRITSRELNRKYRGLTSAQAGQNPKGERNWLSFVELCVFDIVQQLGCIPYCVEPTLHYDMQVMVDVSEKATYFVLSLMIWKKGMRTPFFDAHITRKTDRGETINGMILGKAFADLLGGGALSIIRRYNVSSMLVLRDGHDCDREFRAIEAAVSSLKGRGLPTDFRFDFAEYHKSSQKEIRFWDRTNQGIENALEGTFFVLDARTAVLATTGSGTLRQGTAQPVLIKTKHIQGDLMPILSDVFHTSQLNFSSPTVAQRLTYPAKRADELLQDRQAREIVRIR